jgi:methylenetetrahydrofolate dehydrogenase (NADP+)/methenyltetrahydrofolate cyclohydrolase
MKILDGRELVGYIEERQAKQVRALRQAWNTYPKLAIIVANDSQVIDTYVRLKRTYGEEILIDVEVYKIEQTHVADTIRRLNEDDTVHGIILQLPLTDQSETDEFIALIDPAKDVDGLGPNAEYVSATATAIDWLLAGYNVALKERKIAIVGNGRLVGAPLARLWLSAGLDVTVYDDTATNLQESLRAADVIVTATGVRGLLLHPWWRQGRCLLMQARRLKKVSLWVMLHQRFVNAKI